jgi:peptidoglycan hydrolase-like protein with peptidoglycan-binding domain
VPPPTVDRVQQAEEDLASVSEGITDETLLAEATEQFNSAAFAVEVSWLRLYADAGCLTDEQQAQALTAVTEYTVALQTSLQIAGYFEDEVDGVYGPLTVEAVERLQTDNDLPVTGLVDSATAAALDAAVLAADADAAAQAQAHTASVQSTLTLLGYWTGPVDGEWTPELTEALMELQTDLGVEPTGAVDAATLAALEEAMAQLGTLATSTTTTSAPTTSTPASTSTTTSAPTTTGSAASTTAGAP